MKRIGDYSYLHKLNKLLGVQASAETPIGNLLEDIRPVFDIRELLADWSIELATMDLSGGGHVLFFTVPEGEKWEVARMTTSATVAASETYAIDSVTTQAIILIVSGTVATAVEFSKLTLQSGWRLTRSGTGDVGDTSESMTILVRKWKVVQD